ncbi:MAG: hypothetical protein ABS79_00175 [Planctomycetes bacterium SCN 63-9]|nr:MAG: hypothetical protein ABS79_00175 [Planctomycetes bacterium SCN 63-9]
MVDPRHADFTPSYRNILSPLPAYNTNTRHIPHNPNISEADHIPLAEVRRLTALVRRCPFRSKPACGCQGAAACALKGGIDVSSHTCWDCVRRYEP